MFILSTASVKFRSGHLVADSPKSLVQGFRNLLSGYDWEHHEVAETLSRWEFLEHALGAMKGQGEVELIGASLNLHQCNLRYLSEAEAQRSLENLVGANGTASHASLTLTAVLRTEELSCSVQFAYSDLHKDGKAPLSVSVGVVPSAMRRRENEGDNAYAIRIARTRFRTEQVYKEMTTALLANLIRGIAAEGQIEKITTLTLKKRKVTVADLTVYTVAGGPLDGLSSHDDLAFMVLRQDIREARKILSSPHQSTGAVHHMPVFVGDGGSTGTGGHISADGAQSALDASGEFWIGDFGTSASSSGSSDFGGDFGTGDFADSASADGGSSDGGGGDGGSDGGGDGGGGCGGGCGGGD